MKIVDSGTSEHFSLYLWWRDGIEPLCIGQFDTREEAEEIRRTCFSLINVTVNRVVTTWKMEVQDNE